MKKLIIIALLVIAASTYSFGYTNSKVYSASYYSVKEYYANFNHLSTIKYYMVVFSKVADNPGGTARAYLDIITKNGTIIASRGLRNKPGIDLSSIRDVAYDPTGNIATAHIYLTATYYQDLSFIRLEW